MLIYWAVGYVILTTWGLLFLWGMALMQRKDIAAIEHRLDRIERDRRGLGPSRDRLINHRWN